ncbi:MAG TPA: rhodanese-like domain-containing protein [Anaerolineales bacterium]|nr:rhodanese-like domain-containing protein [Anaerolineales bacterium]
MTRKHHTASSISSDSHRRHRNKSSGRNLTWLWIALGVLALVGAGILLLRPQAAPSVEISPAQAYNKYQQGAFILDVRSQDEWNQFHIKGSTLIPLDQLPSRLSEVPKDQDVVVVCLTGHRSQSGTAILQQAGYTHVFCLSGGLTAWNAAGYPLEGTAP